MSEFSWFGCARKVGRLAGAVSTCKPCGSGRGARCILPGERNHIGNETNPIGGSFVERLDAWRGLLPLVSPAGAAAARVVFSREKGTTSEMKRILLGALLLSGLMLAVAQVKKEDLATKNTASPGAETSVTVNGKNIWIYYHAPSVRGRHIFGGAGALQPDGSVWRLGADYATVLHTDADLNGLAIPTGDYTLYADLDNGQWKLIVNKTLMAGARHIDRKST